MEALANGGAYQFYLDKIFVRYAHTIYPCMVKKNKN